jgi:hypothetical protein
MFERSDIERIAKAFDLTEGCRARLIEIATKGAAKLGLETETGLIEYMKMVSKSVYAESEGTNVNSHKKSGYWDRIDIWTYLCEHPDILEFSLGELPKKAYQVFHQLEKRGLLGSLYDLSGEKPEDRKSKKTSPEEEVMTYRFARCGKLRTVSETGEILPIENRLRRENRGLFDQGYRFVMNCLDDAVEIGKARRWIQYQNPRLRTTKIARTYDSAERELEGYVAIFAGPRRQKGV